MNDPGCRLVESLGLALVPRGSGGRWRALMLDGKFLVSIVGHPTSFALAIVCCGLPCVLFRSQRPYLRHCAPAIPTQQPTRHLARGECFPDEQGA